MPVLTDNFQRSNQDPISSPWTLFGDANSVQLLNHGFAPSSSSVASDLQTGVAIQTGSGPFGPDQFSQAVVKTTAPFLATMTISAAAQSGGNTTFTYVLLTGTPVFVGMNILVNGMQNAGNNSSFVVTGILGSTFTVANASGVTESGSFGTGTAPSDSRCGLAVRVTPDGLNYWYVITGPASPQFGSIYEGDDITDPFVYMQIFGEVRGGVDFPSFNQPYQHVVDSPGDVISLSAQSQPGGVDLFTFSINGVEISTQGSLFHPTGYPGIISQTYSGQQTPTKPGNAGTVWTDWIGSDGGGAAALLLMDQSSFDLKKRRRI